MAQMTLITGAQRRRRWSFEERRQILAAATAPGAVVTEVARRADICTSLIYKWLREEREPQADAGFAAAILVDDAAPLASAPDAAAIVVEFAAGARVRIGAAAPAALVTATLRALRR
jgi:transposase